MNNKLPLSIDELALNYFPDDFNDAGAKFLIGARYFASKIADTHAFSSCVHLINRFPLIAAIFSPKNATDGFSVALETAATHGYGEGKLGNAVQQMLFYEQEGLNPVVKKISIQAVNPFGYVKFTRENENGVDLNRNGVYDPDGSILDSKLNEIHRIANELLIPKRARTDEESEARYFRESVNQLIETYGRNYARNVLAMGGNNPGLFYRGNIGTPEESVRILGDIVKRETEGAVEFLHIDFHSGYGSEGVLLCSTHHRTDTDQFARLAQAMPNLVSDSLQEGSSYTYPVTGSLIEYLAHRSNAHDSCGVIIDIGVLKEIETLEILAARYQTFNYGGSEEIDKKTVMDMEKGFCPPNPEWRTNAIQLFRELMQQINSEFNIYIQQELHSVGV